MNNIDKNKILNEIEKYSPVFKPAGRFQYRIRCPICGDSQKNINDAHCYIKCSTDPDEPILYHCFLCNAGDRVNVNFFKKLLSSDNIPDDVFQLVSSYKYNRIGSLKKVDVDIVTGTPILDSPQVKYIESRLGTGFTYEDYDRFKIIWDWSNIHKSISDKRILNRLPNNFHSVTFLSDDKSVILTRQYDDNNGRWNNMNIFQSENRSMYTIKTTLNLFTKDQIVVNICEGVFDALSIYKNFNDCENSIYLAVLGSEYISGVNYIIAKGVIGSNVDIRIYIDGDQDMDQLRKRLKRYKWLFNSISILENIKYKDVGTKIENIKLIEKHV